MVLLQQHSLVSCQSWVCFSQNYMNLFKLLACPFRTGNLNCVWSCCNSTLLWVINAGYFSTKITWTRSSCSEHHWAWQLVHLEQVIWAVCGLAATALSCELSILVNFQPKWHELVQGVHNATEHDSFYIWN